MEPLVAGLHRRHLQLVRLQLVVVLAGLRPLQVLVALVELVPVALLHPPHSNLLEEGLVDLAVLLHQVLLLAALGVSVDLNSLLLLAVAVALVVLLTLQLVLVQVGWEWVRRENR